mgnify:CR=1 FL=1
MEEQVTDLVPVQVTSNYEKMRAYFNCLQELEAEAGMGALNSVSKLREILK